MANTNTYQIEKTYVKNNPRYGRTTTLRIYRGGVLVDTFVGIGPSLKRDMVRQYEAMTPAQKERLV
jgi:hypothetical protein